MCLTGTLFIDLCCSVLKGAQELKRTGSISSAGETMLKSTVEGFVKFIDSEKAQLNGFSIKLVLETL